MERSVEADMGTWLEGNLVASMEEGTVYSTYVANIVLNEVVLKHMFCRFGSLYGYRNGSQVPIIMICTIIITKNTTITVGPIEKTLM